MRDSRRPYNTALPASLLTLLEEGVQVLTCETGGEGLLNSAASGAPLRLPHWWGQILSWGDRCSAEPCYFFGEINALFPVSAKLPTPQARFDEAHRRLVAERIYNYRLRCPTLPWR